MNATVVSLPEWDGCDTGVAVVLQDITAQSQLVNMASKFIPRDIIEQVLRGEWSSIAKSSPNSTKISKENGEFM